MPQKIKKKHPKYRNKLSPEKKKELSTIKRNVQKHKLKKDIYRLPFDIKCKIFQMAMISNIPQWIRKIKPKFSFVKKEMFHAEKGLGYIDRDGFPKNFTFANYKSHIGKINSWKSLDLWKVRNNLPCNKNIKTGEQRGIISVYIHPDKEKPGLVKYREFSNTSNYFWTHYKCRCYECDLIRVTAGDSHFKWSSIKDFEEGEINDKKYIRNYSKHKFRGITMDPEKITQWSLKK